MKLMMLFGNEVIDLIKIRKGTVSTARLMNLKERLINRNEESLNVAGDAPQFALHALSFKHGTATNFELI